LRAANVWYRALLRIRILKPPTGNVDGIPLDKFFVACTYDVGTTLGNYLLSEGWAEPVDDDRPALIVPLDVAETSAVPPCAQDRAADATPRRRRTPR
jgi:hypothetical protein